MGLELTTRDQESHVPPTEPARRPQTIEKSEIEKREEESEYSQ